MNDGLVSIIMPVFNSERYLTEAIESVRTQTFRDWELIAVDDGSRDGSVSILSKYASIDRRIRIIFLSENRGVSYARNTGISLARGRYLCFLDSDDLWDIHKLELQINCMTETGSAFTFTGYRLIYEDGRSTGQIVPAPFHIAYKEALSRTAIWTCTVCIDLYQVKRPQMPSINGAEDTAAWLAVLRQVSYATGIDKVLASYRQVPTSLSHDLKSRLSRMWTMYRTVESFSLWKSAFLYVKWAWYVAGKRKRPRK